MVPLSFIALIILAGMILTRIAVGSVKRFGQTKRVERYRIAFITKTIRVILGGLTIFACLFIAGVDYSQVAVFLSSLFAVIGMALFAQWSILSNLTAGWIIFFHFPYRIGDTIRVADKDDDISGTIIEIGAFHVLIEHGNTIITYPNAVILQKAVIKVPKGSNPSRISPPEDGKTRSNEQGVAYDSAVGQHH